MKNSYLKLSSVLIPILLLINVAQAAESQSSAGLTPECNRLSDGIRLTAVGDILIHKALYENIQNSQLRFTALWKNLTPKLQSADITYGNLEGPIAPGTKSGGYATKDPGFFYDGNVYSGTNFLFNYHPYLVDDLKSTGFDILSNANNHSMDRGSAGIDLTIQNIISRGLTGVGARLKNSSKESFIQTMQSKGAKFGFIACTEMLNGNPDRYQQILNCRDPQLVSMIEQTSRKVDALIIFPHWGNEYQNLPSSAQRSLAKIWINAGAKAIIGSHPHVLQTTEWIENSHHESALVIYSLGNFVAGQAAMERRATALAHLDFQYTSGKLNLVQYSYTPVIRPRGSIGLSLVRTDILSPELNHIRKQMGTRRCQ